MASVFFLHYPHNFILFLCNTYSTDARLPLQISEYLLFDFVKNRCINYSFYCYFGQIVFLIIINDVFGWCNYNTVVALSMTLSK